MCRCIKPNTQKKPSNFTWDYVRPQLEVSLLIALFFPCSIVVLCLQCGGIIEALRILKCGFPTRAAYEKIFQRYGSILKPTPPDLNKRDFCEAVLRNCGETLPRSEFQLGLTKVFFRPGKQDFLEKLLDEVCSDCVVFACSFVGVDCCDQGGELDEETIKRIKRFLRNKRFFRARGAIRVHVRFAIHLRRMRALRLILRVVCPCVAACV